MYTTIFPEGRTTKAARSRMRAGSRSEYDRLRRKCENVECQSLAKWQSVQKHPLRSPCVGKYDLIGANSETKAHLCRSHHRFGANHTIGCAIHLACWSLRL